MSEAEPVLYTQKDGMPQFTSRQKKSVEVSLRSCTPAER